MTDDEIHAEIGRLVARYRAGMTRHAALRSKIADLLSSMRRVVDSAHAGGQLSVRAIRRDQVPPDGWAGLGPLLDELAECRSEIESIEADLRSAQLGELVQELPS